MDRQLRNQIFRYAMEKTTLRHFAVPRSGIKATPQKQKAQTNRRKAMADRRAASGATDTAK